MTRPKWNYLGDINLEHGGFFWREDGAEDYVLAVVVTPCSDAGGADNLFHIEEGSIYIPSDPKRLQSALDVIGVPLADANRRDIVEALRAYGGIERDNENVVRIGPEEEQWSRGGGWNPEPDTILRGNAKLANYVRREYLRG